MTDEKAIEKMLYDQQQGWPLCPRCGERMPDKPVSYTHLTLPTT